jgi:hypothetical protein
MSMTVRIFGYAEVPLRGMDLVFGRLARCRPDIHGHESAPDRLRVDVAVTRPDAMSEADWRHEVDRVQRELSLVADVPVHWVGAVSDPRFCESCTTLPPKRRSQP